MVNKSRLGVCDLMVVVIAYLLVLSLMCACLCFFFLLKTNFCVVIYVFALCGLWTQLIGLVSGRSSF